MAAALSGVTAFVFVSMALMLLRKTSRTADRLEVLKQFMPLAVKMKEYDEDRCGGLTVELCTEDNKNFNAAMVCSGAAWWCECYAPDRRKSMRYQEDAQKNKRGL